MNIMLKYLKNKRVVGKQFFIICYNFNFEIFFSAKILKNICLCGSTTAQVDRWTSY
jgi:hypothetical protein